MSSALDNKAVLAGAVVLFVACAVGAADIFSVEDAGANVRFRISDAGVLAAPSGGGMSIGAAAPDATAILDLSSTTKGFLPPRMDVTQRDAIVTPPAGLVIYNTTTNALNLFDGTAWRSVSTAGGGTPSGADFEDRFEGTDDWADVGSLMGVNTAADRLDIETNTSTVHHASGYDLQNALGGGVNLSDTQWVMRVKYVISNIAQGGNPNDMGVFISVSDVGPGTNFLANVDAISFSTLIASNYRSMTAYAADNSRVDLPAGARRQFATLPAATTYYIEFIRSSAIEATVELFSDEFVTSIEKETLVVAATTVDLRHVRVLNRFTGSGSPNSTLNGYLDYVMVWNDVTSVP